MYQLLSPRSNQREFNHHGQLYGSLFFLCFFIQINDVQDELTHTILTFLSLQSYCHTCSGGHSNQKYTFGGTYVAGPRNNVNSYTNTPLSGSISYEARRVNVQMFNHVSNPHRAECTVAPPQCFQDSDCSDGNDCNGIETCNLSTNSCELGTPQSNCCGNNVCEAGEDFLSCPQDGCVFDCGGAGCQEFVTTWAGGSGSLGNFFKIQALKPIVITGLTKMHANAAGLRTVRVYQKAGDYVGFESNSGSWNSVWSNVVTVDSGGGQADLPRFDAPIILDTGEFHSFHIWDSIGKHNCDQVILCVFKKSNQQTTNPIPPLSTHV